MKIAIAGYGLEGESNYRYWSQDKNNEVIIVDENEQTKCNLPEGAKTLIGKDIFSSLQGFDMVVRTAGLAPRKIKTGGKIWSSTNEFFDKCPAEIIGVTGSKGKGTTASLIASILEKAGKKVWLVGNIGKPALDVLSDIKPGDIVVYEISSFQLWDLEKSPHTAVVLFIEQEHLDVHKDMEEYVAAKANITRHQLESDLLVYNRSNKYACSIAAISKARAIGYTDDSTAHVKDGRFCYGEQDICSVDSLHIIGKHNYDNACAAIDAIWGHVSDSQIIEAGLGAFSGLPHRLQFVREVENVRYYDDSIATTPSSAIAALQTFDGKSKVIILGGSYKGSDFSGLANELLKHAAKAILMGAEATTIAKACDEAGFKDYEILDNPTATNMVLRAKQLSKPGGIVLLSPASASFGLFKNYADRGEQFSAAVEAL